MWVPPSPPQTSYAALNTLKNSKQFLLATIKARDRRKIFVLSALIGVLLFEALASPRQSVCTCKNQENTAGKGQETALPPSHSQPSPEPQLVTSDTTSLKLA